MTACPACGKENPEGFSFCGYCSAALELAQPSQAEERKIVSVLFCDLVGFTTASESADPEDVRARLVPYHARVRDEIEAFGGVVEKFVGDAVMAAFGAPVAHEDDAERAVRAALRVLEAIEELNGADPTLELTVRIAINTGEALVALGARPELGEAMVAGDVVNTASRLQGAAPVSSVVVGEATYLATRPIFVWQELEAVELKGKAAPTRLWQAVEARGRFGVDILRAPTTPFVGRDRDLVLLTTLFERAATERSVQLVTLIGEPGVGKSRLVAELGAALDQREELIAWRQGRCLPYGEGISYWALGEIVKAQAGILESDSVDVAKDKLAAVLGPLGDDAAWVGQRLAPLLGADALTQAQQDETFIAWRRFLESIAANGSAVLVIEDLHWADEPMVEFLDHVAEWSSGAPMLIVATARPEFLERFPGWGAGRRNALTLTLSPLTDAETGRLVNALLDTVLLPADLQSAIIERAGGNPLYAEEFVRILIDRGLLVRNGAHVALQADAQIEAPDTVQALIAARLDTLEPSKKSLVHDASVIGKVFWSGALVAMGDRDPEQVRAALHDLTAKELVRPARSSSIEGEHEFAFWHALVRDVAYGQIPRAMRAGKHLAAAAWIEEAAADRPQEVAEILVHHYDAAIGFGSEAKEIRGSLVRALRDAAKRSQRTDLAHARRHLERALALSDDDNERAEIGTLLGGILTSIGEFDTATEALDEAIAAFHRTGDLTGMGTAMIARVTGLWKLAGMGSVDDDAIVAKAIGLLEAGGPSLPLARAYLAMASQLYIRAEFASAIGWADRAIETLDELGQADPFELRWQRARAMLNRGVNLMLTGDNEGESSAETGIDELISIGAIAPPDQSMLAEARLPLNGPGSALETMHSSIELSERIGDVSSAAWARSSTLCPLFDLGEWNEAIATADRCVRDAEERGSDAFLTWVKALLAIISSLRGHHREAATLLADVRSVAVESTDGQIRATVLSAAVLVGSMRGDHDDAMALTKGLSESQDMKSDWYYVSRTPILARACVAAGRPDLLPSLTEGVSPKPRGHENALISVEAIRSESSGAFGKAAQTYADAAERWSSFPSVPERAFSLLGMGRCLLQLGDPDATFPLRDARDIFFSLGATPLITDTDEMLAKAIQQTS
jgi:class 3 adenylate cyclase